MNKIGGSFNVEQKHQEAKDAMRGLLEIINAQYVAQLRKDPNKQAEFIHSKYSLMDGILKVEEKFLLKDILSIV
jgi:hypothetical protein